jgi:starch-binding outer membrane protein SusE/F
MKLFMKRLTLYRFLFVLITAAIVVVSCKKEQSNVRLDPKLATSQVINIKSDSATVVGFVVAAGDGFSERGVCYNTQTGPTTADSKVVFSDPVAKATFNVKLSGLSYATKYYARAYAINTNGTIYGDEVTFTTLPVVPTLTTAAITTITGNSAAGGGNVTVGGGANVTARGICFGKNHNPTITDSKTSNGTGTGAFVSALAGLKGNTIYYVRAYATNSAGTGYGPEVTFTTLIDLPVITTTAVTAITKISAVSGGEVTYDGGGTVTARGLAWGAASNPTIAGTIIDGGTGTGVFVSNLTGLVLNTTYHIRAYATNSAGTAYGPDISFTTLADITKFWVVGDYNGWDNSDNAKYIISTATSSGAAEGYVYLTTGAIKLTTDHSWDNAHTFGDNGSGGLTNPGGNIPVTVAGYYLIKANLGAMTYSLTNTTWGIMGDYNGWSSQTDMTYNPSTLTFSLALHLTSGGAFKFRGTSDWSINYGSTAADGTTLNAGGDNIPVTLTADYALTLDLSHPNLYTYSANSWGLIGDFNSWGGDHVMTWDATNHVFTGTIDASAAGAFKFRANGAWTINLGGNLNALSAGGDNIPIAAAGNYTITLDPWGLKATVTKN